MGKRRNGLLVLAAVAVLALVAAACSSDDNGGGTGTTGGGGTTAQNLSGTITISGSSTVQPITSLVAELFNEDVSSDVSITVDGPGTG
jgi:phosphate transport system substrate-binding protein